MAETTLGKLKNLDAPEELLFAMNPTDYRLSRGVDFSVEPCLGQPAPIVAFRSGHAAELSFSLAFDQDAVDKCDLKKVGTFIKGLNKIQDKTKSVPLIEFTLGSFNFRGYVRHYVFHPLRFDAKGDPTSARLELTMLSNGDYEHGKT